MMRLALLALNLVYTAGATDVAFRGLDNDDECLHEDGQVQCALSALQRRVPGKVSQQIPDNPAARGHAATKADATRFTALSPDPNILLWHNSAQPGNFSQGTLSVHLDPLDADSPILQLEVVMKFAAVQPAPLGPLLVHCGGPGSGADCVLGVAGEELEGFDMWSISQRGIGSHAEPALKCHSSKLPEECPESGCRISDFTNCSCALLDGMPQIGEIWADVDPRNQSQVENLLTLREEWGRRCAASNKFQLHGTNGKRYNFLEYVGTELLTQDIDRMRRAIGASKMSIYGFSYGTFVGGLYATVFSEFVDKLVLDGNMDPMPRKVLQATGDAAANDKFIAELIADCKSLPSNCSLAHPQRDYDKVVALARAGNLSAPTKSGKRFKLTVGMLMAYLQYESTSNSGRGFARATRTLAKLLTDNTRENAVSWVLDGHCLVQGNATWYHCDICVGPGHTMTDEGDGFAEPYIEQCAVWGADQAGYYSVPDAMRLWRSVARDYGEAGLAAAVGDMAGYLLWPVKATPGPPIGSTTVRAVIIGNLFDTSTSYFWSQNMRRAFPAGSMITWQGVGHTMPGSGPGYNEGALTRCREHLRQYLQTGILPLDGG